jgi:hypothetical protein
LCSSLSCRLVLNRTHGCTGKRTHRQPKKAKPELFEPWRPNARTWKAATYTVRTWKTRNWSVRI